MDSRTPPREYEMHHITPETPTSPLESREQAAERQRVRFNSSAAQIPPPSGGYATLEQVETAQPENEQHTYEAETLLRAHTHYNTGDEVSSRAKPDQEYDPEDDGAYSGNTQGGVFYQLLQAYKNPVGTSSHDTHSNVSLTPPHYPRPGSSGAETPATQRRKWYHHEKDARSSETLATLVGVSAKLANPNDKSGVEHRRAHKRNSSGGRLFSAMWKAKEEQDAKIKIHVADILKRQRYIIKICRALMLFGAPTHRLEEYLAMTAQVLEINSQFLYIPGCMIISFDDALTHTAEVKIVRTTQGVNLGKLKDTHDVYKEVLHDVISLDEALSRLEDIINAPNRHPVWLCVLMYGLASTAVSCFFKARPIDFPIIFGLGCILGTLQLVIAPLSKTYATVFEISATILMSFLARAFGSIRGGSLFCFSALAQSSIALILPGWLVLSAALELQSKAIVPGSIRLVYAIIYSLFLGYGITVGTALYGAIDSNATSETKCRDPMNPYWNFLMVPFYVLFATFTVQAKYKQMPVMIGIATTGYAVNFWSSQKFSASAPIAYTFGAFTVGVLANTYSRLRHGVAAAVLLPAVYVQVPGSLASSGSIATALETASSLVKGAGQAATGSTDSLNAIVFNVAASMIQIAIGITVGLFMSALVIYPLGKRRSGLWTL